METLPSTQSLSNLDQPVFWVIAGTSEGRRLAESLSSFDALIYVSVATDYGKYFIEPKENLIIESKRLNQEDMVTFMQERCIDCVIDATHPYAQEVTKNISEVCTAASITYLRLLREDSKEADCLYTNDTKQAAEYLSRTDGKILLTCGSKELEIFTSIPHFADRMYLRVLPVPEVLQKCLDLGFKSPHIIGMQGPFSKEMNIAMIKSVGAEILVTKDSGNEGGFQEKIEAAHALGVKVIIIRRPVEKEGYTVSQVLQKLMELYQLVK